MIAQHLHAGGERFRERLSAFEERGQRQSEANEQQTAIKGRAVEPHFLSPPPRARPKVQRSGDQDSEEYKAKKHPPVPKEKPKRQPRLRRKRQRDPQRLEKHRKGRQDEEQDHQKKHQREGKHKERIRQRTREAPPEQILLLIVQRDVCQGRRQCPRHFSHFQQRNKKRRTPAACRKAIRQRMPARDPLSRREEEPPLLRSFFRREERERLRHRQPCGKECCPGRSQKGQRAAACKRPRTEKTMRLFLLKKADDRQPLREKGCRCFPLRPCCKASFVDPALFVISLIVKLFHEWSFAVGNE